MAHKIVHFFFPHESNNHKALFLNFSSLAFYLTAFLIIQLSLSVLIKSTPQVLGIASDISVDRLLYLTNQERLENGLQPLQLNKDLSKAAAEKAKDMFANDYWAHNSPQGKTPWDFILASNYKYIYAGENLAKDFANSDGVVAAWMKSPSHKENILQGRYEDIGLAIVNGHLDDEDTTLVVQMFGKKDESQKGVVSQASSIINNDESNTKSAVSENKKIPIDAFQITKISSLLLGLFLTFLVFLDMLFFYKKKIIRVSGHSLAHFGFLLALIAVIYLTGRGVII